VTQPRPGNAARVRLFIAIGLGAVSIAGSLLLAAADAARGSVHWVHHSPISAAPLFLIAGAIAAVSIGRPPQGRHALLRLVAVLAFTAWGTAQLTPDPAAAGAFNDAAILLFVIDGGCAVVTEARAMLAHHRQPAQPTPKEQSSGPRPRAAARQPDGVARPRAVVQDPCSLAHALQASANADRYFLPPARGDGHTHVSLPCRCPARCCYWERAPSG
jgi:hypothetical protein